MVFCDRLLSLSTMFSGFASVAVCISIPFLLMTECYSTFTVSRKTDLATVFSVFIYLRITLFHLYVWKVACWMWFLVDSFVLWEFWTCYPIAFRPPLFLMRSLLWILLGCSCMEHAGFLFLLSTSLSLVFNILPMMGLDVDLFVFVLFGVYRVSYIFFFFSLSFSVFLFLSPDMGSFQLVYQSHDTLHVFLFLPPLFLIYSI